jgi:hypothetical protein
MCRCNSVLDQAHMDSCFEGARIESEMKSLWKLAIKITELKVPLSYSDKISATMRAASAFLKQIEDEVLRRTR